MKYFLILSLLSFDLYASVLTEVKIVQQEPLIADLIFSEPVDKSNISIDYINETIQINLNDTQLIKPKMNTKVSNDKIKSIFTYKLNENNSRTRIILNKGIQAKDYQDKLTLEVANNIAKVSLSPLKTQVDVQATASETTVDNEDLKQAEEWAKSSSTLQAEVENKKKLENLKESEIPVFEAKSQDSGKTPGFSAARVFVSLGVVLLLMGGLAIFLKKYSKNGNKNKNSQIKILTQHFIGPKKSLAIIRVAGESMLIGISDNNISLIKTLALLDEEVPTETPTNFNKTLGNKMNSSGAETEDEFSFSKVKDFVNGRLKNMKEL